MGVIHDLCDFGNFDLQYVNIMTGCGKCDQLAIKGASARECERPEDSHNDSDSSELTPMLSLHSGT